MRLGWGAVENAEHSGAHYRTTATTPTIPDYRPLVDMKKGRLLMPARCTVVVEVTGLDGLAHVELGLELIGRRYQVTRLEASPPAGSGLDLELVRKLDVPLYARYGVAHLVIMESPEGEQYTASSPLENPDPLWPVATTYSVAYALGEPPTAAVATDLGISHAAAAQRVKRARDAGYLPPTEKGRAS